MEQLIELALKLGVPGGAVIAAVAVLAVLNSWSKSNEAGQLAKSRERKQLSQDEKNLRDSLIQQVASLQEENRELRQALMIYQNRTKWTE